MNTSLTTNLSNLVLVRVTLSAFDAAMVKVCEAPHRYRVDFPPNIRRYRIPGFPYNVLYRQVGGDIEVLVIAPHRRRPNYWLGGL